MEISKKLIAESLGIDVEQLLNKNKEEIQKRQNAILDKKVTSCDCVHSFTMISIDYDIIDDLVTKAILNKIKELTCDIKIIKSKIGEIEMNNNILEKYKIKMQNAIDNEDEELGHIQCDDVLCDLLKELGYGKIIEIYDDQKKYYS